MNPLKSRADATEDTTRRSRPRQHDVDPTRPRPASMLVRALPRSGCALMSGLVKSVIPIVALAAVAASSIAVGLPISGDLALPASVNELDRAERVGAPSSPAPPASPVSPPSAPDSPTTPPVVSGVSTVAPVGSGLDDSAVER